MVCAAVLDLVCIAAVCTHQRLGLCCLYGRIIFALRQYAHCLEQEVQRWEHNYAALSAHHRTLLHHLPGKAAAARRAMQQNQLFIKAMLYNFAGVNGPEPDAEAGEQQEPEEQRGAGMPDDLYTGAVQAADAMQAAGAKCSPVDAEKVRPWKCEGYIANQDCCVVVCMVHTYLVC